MDNNKRIRTYDIASLLQKKMDWKSSDFVFFWGHTDRGNGLTKACLSQWLPCSFFVDGQYYNCTEQYMMAEKARIFGDDDIRQQILAEYNQMTIKKLGRKVSGYDDEVWKSVRFDVVVKGNVAKFSQNEKLKEFLIGTGNKVIVEASPKDDVWGIGLEETVPEAANPSKWKGTNLLGFALMEVRDILISEQNK